MYADTHMHRRGDVGMKSWFLFVKSYIGSDLTAYAQTVLNIDVLAVMFDIKIYCTIVSMISSSMI